MSLTYDIINKATFINKNFDPSTSRLYNIQNARCGAATKKQKNNKKSSVIGIEPAH